MLRKKCKLGRKIDEISIGETLTVTEKIEDKDLLLYLGLTDDANPLYIQHDYASQTPYKKPIVPSVMLTGMVLTAMTKYLPGPGSHILRQELEFIQPVHHYETLTFQFEVIAVYVQDHTIEVRVHGQNTNKELVIRGLLTVAPPHHHNVMWESALENF
ncbi:MaoC family dehydratase N-terminal domain-containing protein [Ectobacillus sp. JY-23]|uniref:MaoC family dehydratase n=1 Tax=Ectobacillus sp. JY-23 TaxID=2933872 RepID=UPI001FF1C83A|nr:MaoC/PaaZ C-terminal domain-containing protein [Ectobacillus sp. JY-23]UOY94276.1 MaoC family dehydratase N-terminal domain-containing protein [Ectobacillus sp. JY-23]